MLEQSAYFIITQLLGTASWRITSASGSVLRHTLSAAELRLVVDVRLDRGWRERSQKRKSEGDGDRWRETQTADRKAVIKSPCFFFFSIISSFRLRCSSTPSPWGEDDRRRRASS